MGKIQRIVIHCTATPAGREVSFDDIWHWHKDPAPKGNGWTHFGYHVLIHLDGTFDYLQQLPYGPYLTNDSIANGAKGYNHSSLHVCYVGGLDPLTRKPADTRTEAQKATLVKVIKMLRERYGKFPVVGHHDLNRLKACPCFDARKEYIDV